MSKLMLVSLFMFTLLPAASLAQSGSDPLNWTAPIKVKSGNIFSMWTQTDGGSILTHRQVYRYILNSDSLSVYKRLDSTADHSNDPTAVGPSGQVDVAAGYFTKSIYENVVGAFTTARQTIEIVIPHFDSTSNMWSTSTVVDLPDTVVPISQTATESGEEARVYVKTGDFLGNGLEQFVLAYIGSDSTIHIQVYSLDNNLYPHLIASINDEKITVNLLLSKFSIATGDLNGAGKDEIILNFAEANYNGTGDWGVYTKIYELSGNTLVPKARQLVFYQPANLPAPVRRINFGSAVGHFNDNPGNMIAFAIGTWVTNGNTVYEEYTSLYMLKVSADLDTISRDSSHAVDFSQSMDYQPSFCIASGDLNGAGLDQIIVMDGYDFAVFSVDNSDNIIGDFKDANLPWADEYTGDGAILSHDFMAVGDVNQDGRADVVIQKDFILATTSFTAEQGLETLVFSFSNDLSKDSTLAADFFSATGSYNASNANELATTLFHFAVAVGDFNGGNFTITAPHHYAVSHVVQPIVVLNTPPVQFDILHGTKYDLSNCFSGNGCSFYSTYEQQSSTSVNLETRTHNDVSDAAGVDLSGSVSAGVSAGVGVQVSTSVSANFEMKVEGTWGHSFANNNSSTQTTSLQIGVSAMGDDQIYATVSSYNLWVYPVYEGTDPAPVNFLNFASPIETHGAWFPSKTYVTNDYVPNHEVGDILSYLPSDSAMNNPAIDSSIVSISQSQGLPISGQSNSYWDFDFSQYKKSSLDSTWNSGWDVNIDVGAAFSSTGDNAHMTTNTTSIMNGWDLRATFGSLVDSLGSAAGYTVYPYAYRSKQGATVLTYAVDPDVAPPGQPQTWWQQNYGHYSDPTFILPWFYSGQQGSPEDTVKKYETTDISFSNNTPQPGDTVTITARVRNFSLVATPMPVTVEFYVGNPDSGGTVITGMNGVDSVVTATAIPSRYWSDVSMRWLVPSGLPQYPRIYAVIDPSNRITKVHESTNMGFAVLGQLPISTVSGIVQHEAAPVPTTAKLYQSYPNPFNPTAEIEYAVPARSFVTLIVYDVLGQKVETLVSGVESAGIHKVAFNGALYASGVYFYRIAVRSLTGNHIAYSKTMKMLELK